MVNRDPITGKVTILESTIRDVMKRSHGNKDAARLLKVSYPIYKKWAKSYIDAETGKSLFELNMGTPKGVPKYTSRGVNVRGQNGGAIHSLVDILDNKVPNYPLIRLKHRLWRAGLKAQECECCGHSEYRISDNQYPLTLSHKDGNNQNYNIDNLEVLCYNCYFLTVGNLWGRRKWDGNEPGSRTTGMPVADMVENVNVDVNGEPTNMEDLGTYDASGVTLDEISADSIEFSDISKEDIEDMLRDEDLT